MNAEGSKEDRETAAIDLPFSKFPVSIIAFGPDGEVVFVRVLKEGPGIMEIPGHGPGSVTRLITVFGDDTYEEYDSGKEEEKGLGTKGR